MAPTQAPFPFAPLPPGEVTPSAGPGDIQDLLQRDIHIARWFITERWGRSLNPASSLGHLLTLSEQLDLKGPAKTVDELDREVARHGLHLSAALVRLAWAVRALHGNSGAVDRIDGSFIDHEVMGEDTSQPGAQRTLPGGIGTLVFAGRLVQAGGGRIQYIGGKGTPGHDIRWVTAFGDTVLVERKDRSYEAGLSDKPECRVAKVIQDTRKAGVTMPRERGAVRILVVGFQHLVRKNEARQVDRAYNEALRRELLGGRVRREDLPNLVIAEHLGLEPRTAGAKFDFFSPQLLNIKPKDLMVRVSRLIVRALGVRL